MKIIPFLLYHCDTVKRARSQALKPGCWAVFDALNTMRCSALVSIDWSIDVKKQNQSKLHLKYNFFRLKTFSVLNE